MSADVLHDSNAYTDRVKAGDGNLEGEGLIKVGAAVLFDNFCLLCFDGFVLHHENNLGVSI